MVLDKSWKNIDRKIETGQEKFEKKQEEKIRKYRQEASRLVSMANKRLQRLEYNKLTDNTAYQSLVGEDGKKPRFSIRGKDYNEVQREVARMNKFLNSETSTVRGSHRVLKEMAKNTGIKYKNLTELKKSASSFFRLANKVEEYLRTVEDRASAVGYQKIWEAVNQYVQEETIDLAEAENDIDYMVDKVVKKIDKVMNEEEKFTFYDTGMKVTGWYTLE